MVDMRRSGKIVDTLLLVEHPHVVTKGSGSSDAHVLVNDEQAAAMGLSVHETTRGGDVTYHGPGQIVGYPIFQLEGEERDAHEYLRRLEEVIIRSLSDFGIEGTRDGEYTGVWVGPNKIAAIGVRLAHWITSHGFALNVSSDLRYFETIVPCGIEGRGVTSMAELGVRASLDKVEDRLIAHFADVFGRDMQEAKIR